MMNFQEFLENDAPLNGNYHEKKKTKGSFKNTYINKINHLMKNIKNKNEIYKENMHRKFFSYYCFLIRVIREVLLGIKGKSSDNEQNKDDFLLDSDYNKLSELGNFFISISSIVN